MSISCPIEIGSKQIPDEIFMHRALELANDAASMLEVPVGAVIIYEGQIISEGINRRECLKNPLLHAEIEAVDKACKRLGRWRLTGCSLYVTLEPCPMCAGAVINSRISRLIYGAYDLKSGSCGSVINLFDLPYNHKPEVTSGVLEKECSLVLSEFFKKIRNS